MLVSKGNDAIREVVKEIFESNGFIGSIFNVKIGKVELDFDYKKHLIFDYIRK